MSRLTPTGLAPLVAMSAPEEQEEIEQGLLPSITDLQPGQVWMDGELFQGPPPRGGSLESSIASQPLSRRDTSIARGLMQEGLDPELVIQSFELTPRDRQAFLRDIRSGIPAEGARALAGLPDPAAERSVKQFMQKELFKQQLEESGEQDKLQQKISEEQRHAAQRIAERELEIGRQLAKKQNWTEEQMSQFAADVMERNPDAYVPSSILPELTRVHAEEDNPAIKRANALEALETFSLDPSPANKATVMKSFLQSDEDGNLSFPSGLDSMLKFMAPAEVTLDERIKLRNQNKAILDAAARRTGDLKKSAKGDIASPAYAQKLAELDKAFGLGAADVPGVETIVGGGRFGWDKEVDPEFEQVADSLINSAGTVLGIERRGGPPMQSPTAPPGRIPRPTPSPIAQQTRRVAAETPNAQAAYDKDDVDRIVAEARARGESNAIIVLNGKRIVIPTK